MIARQAMRHHKPRGLVRVRKRLRSQDHPRDAGETARSLVSSRHVVADRRSCRAPGCHRDGAVPAEHCVRRHRSIGRSALHRCGWRTFRICRPIDAAARGPPTMHFAASLDTPSVPSPGCRPMAPDEFTCHTYVGGRGWHRACLRGRRVNVRRRAGIVMRDNEANNCEHVS